MQGPHGPDEASATRNAPTYGRPDFLDGLGGAPARRRQPAGQVRRRGDETFFGREAGGKGQGGRGFGGLSH